MCAIHHRTQLHRHVSKSSVVVLCKRNVGFKIHAILKRNLTKKFVRKVGKSGGVENIEEKKIEAIPNICHHRQLTTIVQKDR